MGTKDDGASDEAPAPEAVEAVPVAAETPAEPVQAAAAEPTPETPDPVDAAIRSWVDTHIRNSPVSHHVEAWNYLQSKLGALRDAINQGT